MPVLVAEKEKTKNTTATRIGKLAAAAFASISLSTLIAAIFRNSISRMTSHVVFIAAVAAIGLILHSAGYVLERFDAGLVFTLFLFEPMGRVLLRQESAPANIILVLPLALVAAYIFGREDSAAGEENALGMNRSSRKTD